MIRPFTLVTMAMALASGAYMFAVKHRAQALDDQFADIAQQSRLDEQRIRVLQAQWALEIDPARLTALATQFTTLQPMKPAQLVTLAALRDTLPPPGSAVPGSNPAAPAPEMPPPDLGVAPVAQAAPPLPLPPPEPPVLLASAPTPRHATPSHLASRPPAHSALRLASSAAVESLPPPSPLYALPRQNPPMQPTLAAAKTNLPPQLASGSIPQFASGSMLGMAADLAPPQPLPENGGTN
jgi:hypothetical protein